MPRRTGIVRHSRMSSQTTPHAPRHLGLSRGPNRHPDQEARSPARAKQQEVDGHQAWLTLDLEDVNADRDWCGRHPSRSDGATCDELDRQAVRRLISWHRERPVDADQSIIVEAAMPDCVEYRSLRIRGQRGALTFGSSTEDHSRSCTRTPTIIGSVACFKKGVTIVRGRANQENFWKRSLGILAAGN